MVQIITTDPIVAPIGEMSFIYTGIDEMIDWVGKRRPDCLPAAEPKKTLCWKDLFPHECLETDNELLVELAGRKCYDSFGLKAGQKTNAEYIANTQAGDVPHASIMYHAKMTFFVAGVSRRVSHELIRHYVGADRTEEGSPSQESTRYVEHLGYYVAHPAILNDPNEMRIFEDAMSQNRTDYLLYIDRCVREHQQKKGSSPIGMDRKRIFESASPYLSHACETSFIWTTNPIALAKLIRERDHDSADLEFRRLAKKWKAVCLQHWTNLFPQPWMRE